MQIFILNGGLGKRVKKFSKNKPKCLIDFNGKPFLYYQIKLLKNRYLKDIVLCLGYKSTQIISYLKKNKKLSQGISFNVEKKILGTGGALINSKKLMSDIFFVSFGDSYLDLNYKKIYNQFKKSKKSCLITVIHKNKIPYHKPNILIKKKKLQTYKKNYKSNYIDYGLMVFKKEVFLNYSTKSVSLTHLIKKLIQNKDISFVEIKKKFNEIGSEYGIENFKNYIKK